MPTTKRHTIIAECNPHWDWWSPTFHVDCPFDADDSSRDCRMVDEDTREDLPGCGLEHWVSEGGVEAIRVEGEPSWFPIHGHVRWDADGPPSLVLP